MHTVERDPFPDELPTRPAANVSGPLLAFASRVDRLAEHCRYELDRSVADRDALAGALETLGEIQALTAMVLR